MTVEEAKKVIEELKAQGETEEDIVGIFFMMFQDDKLSLEEFEDLIGLMDYELTEEFKNMSPEQQKSDEAWEEIEDEEGEPVEAPAPESEEKEEKPAEESEKEEADDEKARKLFGL
jgi:hypothetical protein